MSCCLGIFGLALYTSSLCICTPITLSIQAYTQTNTRYLNQKGCGCVAFVSVLTVQALRERRSVSSFFVKPFPPSRFRTVLLPSQRCLGSEPCYVPDWIIDLALYIHFLRFSKHVYHRMKEDYCK